MELSINWKFRVQVEGSISSWKIGSKKDLTGIYQETVC